MTSQDGINGRSIQTLLRGENDSKQSDEFQATPDQFRATTAVVGDCSTFAFATETTVEELKNCSKNENTAKSTGFWLSFWKNWCVGKEITDEIENYEPAELNTLPEHFYAEVNNTKKVKIYEPETKP